MTYSHTVTIIIPAAIIDSANRIARAFDPDTGGLNTFGSANLSTTGQVPATHCITHTWARQEFVDLISGVNAGTLSLKTLVDDAYATRWPEGTAPTQQECDTFWADAVIEIDEDWRAALEGQGLNLIVAEEA